MTRREYAELLSGNKRIQERNSSGKWEDIDWNEVDLTNKREYYRHKPDYKEYDNKITFAMDLLEKGYVDAEIKNTSNNIIYKVHCVEFDGVILIDFANSTTIYCTWKELFDQYIWESTNEPCGMNE